MSGEVVLYKTKDKLWKIEGDTWISLSFTLLFPSRPDNMELMKYILEVSKHSLPGYMDKLMERCGAEDVTDKNGSLDVTGWFEDAGYLDTTDLKLVDPPQWEEPTYIKYPNGVWPGHRLKSGVINMDNVNLEEFKKLIEKESVKKVDRKKKSLNRDIAHMIIEEGELISPATAKAIEELVEAVYGE